MDWSKNRNENKLFSLLRLRYSSESASKWPSTNQKPTKQIYHGLTIIWICIISFKNSSWVQITNYKFQKYSTCFKLTFQMKLIANIYHCYKWRTWQVSWNESLLFAVLRSSSWNCCLAWSLVVSTDELFINITLAIIT